MAERKAGAVGFAAVLGALGGTALAVHWGTAARGSDPARSPLAARARHVGGGVVGVRGGSARSPTPTAPSARSTPSGVFGLPFLVLRYDIRRKS